MDDDKYIGHDQEPLGNKGGGAILLDEIGEDDGLGSVTEGPVSRCCDAEECRDRDRVAETKALEHLPRHRRSSCCLYLGNDSIAVGGRNDGDGIEYVENAVDVLAGQGVVSQRCIR